MSCIEVRDTIKSIKALVGWMTRDKGFQIKDENMKDLAHLSDKYMIDSLQQDLRNYVQVAISRKDKMTFEDWKFAARYGFFELEEYCRSSSRLVFVVVKDILRRPQGLEAFYNLGITTAVMSKVVTGMVIQMDQLASAGGFSRPDSTCLGCGRFQSSPEAVCEECRTRCFQSLQGLQGPDLGQRQLFSHRGVPR